jgi:manganese/iron transport system permease protein
MDAIVGPLAYPFFIRALIACVLVGTTCAVVGTYVVLKGLAFMGDAISHAAFPGIVAAFLFKASFYLGAGIAAVATSLAIGYVSRRARIRVDTAVGVLFAGTFALGIFVFSTIRGYTPDLFGFLFGNVVAISVTDLIGLTVLGSFVLLIVAALWKELLYTTFDPLGAGASGLAVGPLEYLFFALVAVTIVVSLQAVGIILVVAMLVTPAATAQQLTVRFGSMMRLAIVVGVGSSVTGLYVSYWLNVASGATIVLVETLAFIVAVVFGPHSGVWRLRRRAGARTSG